MPEWGRYHMNPCDKLMAAGGIITIVGMSMFFFGWEWCTRFYK